MSRAEHTYALADMSVTLTVPDGIEVPPSLVLKRSADGKVGTFRHISVRNVRAARPKTDQPAVRASRIPDDFAVSDDMRAWAAENAPSVNVDAVHLEFVTHWQGSGKAKADWPATWRNWMAKTHRWNVERGWKPTSASKPAGESDRARWLREHGVTAEEFEAKRGDSEWLDRIRRRGRIA